MQYQQPQQITPHIYIISYKNEERLKKMLLRFERLELPKPRIPNAVELNDQRFNNITPIEPRTWAIMLQHLDALTHFYLSSKSTNENEKSAEYCIICEDDVLLSKKLKNNLPFVIKKFNEFNLDVLLLAYLTTSPLTIEPSNDTQYQHIEPHRFYKYPNNQWGSQMYIISREHARHLIYTYTIKWAIEHPNEPYSPDWILTKKGNRALLYPPLGIEDGNTPTNHEEQREFHKLCFEAQYKEGEFI
jgi:GR25 family glycosyltransferase involved in LPS biosynthesis